MIMEPTVRSLTLKGFRSLADVRIEFGNPTFLVGRNGGGKSNIGDALGFISEAMTTPLREVIDRRGGIVSVGTQSPGRNFPRRLGLGVEFGLTEWRQLIENPPAELPPNSLDFAWYAFELNPIGEYEYEVSREQCVLHAQNGTKHWFDRRHKQAMSNITGLTKMELFSPSSLAMPVLGGVLPFESVQQTLSRMKTYSIEPAALREMQDPESGMDLRSDGRNAASVFEEIERRSPETVARINEILVTIVPNTVRLETVQHGKKLTIEFTQGWGEGKQVSFEAYSMSDGTLRALGLLLAVFQARKPSLIFVDEPEDSMHPGAAGAILDTLRHAASTMQVVVSTQSPEILDAKWVEDKNLRSVVWRDGATHVEEIPENAKRALRSHLMGAGELLRSEALEPSPTSHGLLAPSRELFEDIQW
jgi:predicted ATPase